MISGKKTGIELIQEERLRLNEEGWTLETNDKYTDGELAEAASCYAADATSIYYKPDHAYILNSIGYPSQHHELPKDTVVLINKDHRWPWDIQLFRPTPNRINDLKKAGALIAAEIDRINRLTNMRVSLKSMNK